MYKAKVNITLRKSILDPKGKAAYQALQNLGLKEINDVRIGKFIEINVDARSEGEAHKLAQTACTQLLANEVMEDYQITIESA